MQDREHLVEAGGKIRRVLRHARHDIQHRPGLALGQGPQQIQHKVGIHRTQHAAHLRLVHTATAEGNRLIGEAEGVAHAAVGRPGEQPQCGLLEGDHLRLEHLAQVPNHLLRQHVLEVELQAAGQHCRRQLLRVGGGEQKLDVGWRLLEGLQQRIEAAVGEHVHLVDQVDLEARAGGGVLHVVQQLAGVLHLGPRGGIDLQQVDAAPLGDLLAGTAAAAGLRTHPGLAVQALGKDARNGGLAHAAGAGEQVGVVQAVVIQGIYQRLTHMLLTDQFTESAGAPFAGENLVGHENTRLAEKAKDTPARGVSKAPLPWWRASG